MKLLLLVVTLFALSLSAHQDGAPHSFLRLAKQDMQIEFTVPVRELILTVKNLKAKNFDVTYVNNKTGLIHLLINQDDFPTLKTLF